MQTASCWEDLGLNPTIFQMSRNEQQDSEASIYWKSVKASTHRSFCGNLKNLSSNGEIITGKGPVSLENTGYPFSVCYSCIMKNLFVFSPVVFTSGYFFLLRGKCHRQKCFFKSQGWKGEVAIKCLSSVNIVSERFRVCREETLWGRPGRQPSRKKPQTQ